MKKNRFLLFCCVLFVLLVFALFGGCWQMFSSSDELGSYPEWSNLQELSVRGRDSVLKESVIVERMPYETRFITLGVPGKDGSSNVWILLNPLHKPYYKQLPEGDYRIDVTTLLKALATGEVHPYVAKKLASHVEITAKVSDKFNGLLEAEEKHPFMTESGYVLDETTAVLIAEAVFYSIYGEEKIKQERPFKATLNEEIWTVTGTLSKGFKGGTAIAEISKKDGRVIRVSHGK